MSKHSIPNLEAVRSETLLFHPPAYDISIESTSVQEYYPQSSFKDESSPISFVINGSDNAYINPRESKLYLRCKVVKGDGTNLTAVTDAAALNYGTANNLLNSLFERVSVYINETEITSKTNNLNTYRSYLENLLSYSKNYKKSQLEASGFFNVKDESSRDDDGFKSRTTLVSASRTFELIGNLHGDLWKLDRLLLPTLDLRIVLERAANKFCLECVGTAKDNIKIQIEEAKLMVMKHTLMPSAQIAHMRTWEQTPAVYPYRQSVIKTYSLATGTSINNNEHLLSGLLPSRLVIGLLETKNFSGSYDTNPFNFKDQGISKIQVTVNSDKTLEQTLNVDVKNNRYLEAYYNMFTGLGCNLSDPSVDITMSQFLNGKFFYVYDLNHSLNDDTLSLPKHGTINIQLQFKKATEESLTVLCYAEYPQCLTIHNDRSVEFVDHSN